MSNCENHEKSAIESVKGRTLVYQNATCKEFLQVQIGKPTEVEKKLRQIELSQKNNLRNPASSADKNGGKQ